jgi:C-methyltransferase C-terminal domain/Putative zinc binding domain/Methyltransferase domain
MVEPGCRFCSAPLRRTFLDLGSSPLANAFRTAAQLREPEAFLPLHAYVCEACFLVQLEDVEAPEQIFSDYLYFSSFSNSWVEHARRYVEATIPRFGLGSESFVVELASNDGYLLQWFVARGVPVLGVEPAANVAAVAEERGVPSLVEFFGAESATRLAGERRRADLIVGNNVLAHVPALNDFVEGIRILLERDGVVTMEFPHLLRLIEATQFDTIYHEHFSYFSLLTVEQVFAAHGLRLFDVEELRSHGGSLRIYGCHLDGPHETTERISELREREEQAGLRSLETHDAFRERVGELKLEVLDFLLEARRAGRSVAGYGAAAKGVTLLNYCGIRSDLVEYVVDRSHHKQGLFMPGNRIPVHAPERIAETKPDYLLILAWNLKEEIMGQMAHVRKLGTTFVTPVPHVEVHP